MFDVPLWLVSPLKLGAKVQEHANQILNIGISDMPAGVRCFSILPTYYGELPQGD